MKQFLNYDNTQIELPTNLESIKDPLEDNDKEFNFAMEPCDNEPFDNTFSQYLDKLATLPESQKPPQWKLSNSNSQSSDNHFGITYTQKEQNNCLFNCDKQGSVNSGKKSLSGNHNPIGTKNEFTSEDATKIICNEGISEQKQENNVYFVDKIKKHKHCYGKLKFLIK